MGPDRAKVDAMASPCPAADGSSPRQTRFDGPPPMCIDPSRRYGAEMVTSLGSLTIALDPVAAPKTVNNFVFLARYHYFDGLVFHRIITGFMCQGGDPEGNGRGGPGYRFADELPKPGRYEVGSLAMANAGPDTNGSQFFIVSGPSGTSLPPSYSLFGKVVKGLEVVAAMEAVPTGRNDRPQEDLLIESVTITEAE
ncbi:MAG: peptidylprolyl isomerase [Actinomycetota bacterium]|nr:peptidylprolyl isomerase [Actinomycetota bacterium]